MLPGGRGLVRVGREEGEAYLGEGDVGGATRREESHDGLGPWKLVVEAG